jgi:hypothetical protein
METQAGRRVVPLILRIGLFLAAVFAASALFHLYTAPHTRTVYAARAKVTPHLSAQASRRTPARFMLNDAHVLITSEKALERTARTLSMTNVSLSPEQLLATVRVEHIPQSTVLKIELLSEDPKEAELAMRELVVEASKVYFETMNPHGTKESDKNASRLDIVGGIRIIPLPSAALGDTEGFAARFAAALLVLLLGVRLGRNVRRPKARQVSWALRWLGAAVRLLVVLCLVTFLLFAHSYAEFYLFSVYDSRISHSHPHHEYIGRVRLMERLWSKTADAAPRASLDSLSKPVTIRKAARRASKTLMLFNMGKMTPEALVRSAKIERMPDSDVLIVEFRASDPEEAEAAADAIGVELRRIYSGAVNTSYTLGKRESALAVVEEAHVFPVRTRDHDDAYEALTIFAWLYVSASCLLLGATIGALLIRRPSTPSAT